MKHQPKQYTRGIPREILIKDVIAVAKKLRKNTVTRQNYLEHGTYHPSTFRYTFRTWENLLQTAGLQPSRSAMNVTEEDLHKNLEEVWDRLGKQPSLSHLQKKSTVQSKYCATTYVKHFGTWRDALRKFMKYQKLKASAEGAEIQKQVEFWKIPATGNKRRSKNWQPGVRFTSKIAVLLRDGFRCTCCGRSPVSTPGVELYCDYITPWRKGGKPLKDNLRTMCDWCYEGKYGKIERRA